MKSWLKHHLVPHGRNRHRPGLLEWGAMKYLLAVVIFVEVAGFLLPTFAYSSFIGSLNLSAVLPGALSALTNDARKGSDVPQLAENKLLDEAATLKAQDMAAKGYFAHTSPEGRTPWYWFNLVGYQYSFAGENLAVNFSDSADVTQAWLNSPLHRANILSRNYKEMGTGIATGTYKGREAVFVAQLFGTPRSLAGVSPGEALSAWEMFLVSPHRSTNMVLIVLLILTVAALLAALLQPHGRHPDLFVHGLFLVALLAGLCVMNDFLAGRNIETSFVATDSQGAIQ